jgi:hypothetical protein
VPSHQSSKTREAKKGKGRIEGLLIGLIIEPSLISISFYLSINNNNNKT